MFKSSNKVNVWEENEQKEMIGAQRRVQDTTNAKMKLYSITESLSSKDEKDINLQMQKISPTMNTAGLVRFIEKETLDADGLQRLEIRRRLELEIIKKYDRTQINNRHECWFLMDSNWLNEWAAFATGQENANPPNPISSFSLLKADGKTPLDGLESRIDYRGVPPIVFYIFAELYGRDSSPELCRYQVDIYQPPVPVERLVNIQFKASQDAKIQVNKIRPEWMRWEIESHDEEEDSTCCCGWVTKYHVEAFIYWAIMCWSRRKDRHGIKYRNYKPLEKSCGNLDDSSHSMGNRMNFEEKNEGIEDGYGGCEGFKGRQGGVGREKEEGGFNDETLSCKHTLKQQAISESRIRLLLSDSVDSSGFADRGAEKGRWFATLVNPWLRKSS